MDQSALTGESLPVSKMTGDLAYSGSVAKQGEMTALVTATGSTTYFGKTTRLLGTSLAVYGFGLVTPISWGAIGLIWGYSITWAFLEDWTKLMVYRHFALKTQRHQAFLNRVKQVINPQAAH